MNQSIPGRAEAVGSQEVARFVSASTHFVATKQKAELASSSAVQMQIQSQRSKAGARAREKCQTQSTLMSLWGQPQDALAISQLSSASRGTPLQPNDIAANTRKYTHSTRAEDKCFSVAPLLPDPGPSLPTNSTRSIQRTRFNRPQTNPDLVHQSASYVFLSSSPPRVTAPNVSTSDSPPKSTGKGSSAKSSKVYSSSTKTATCSATQAQTSLHITSMDQLRTCSSATSGTGTAIKKSLGVRRSVAGWTAHGVGPRPFSVPRPMRPG